MKKLLMFLIIALISLNLMGCTTELNDEKIQLMKETFEKGQEGTEKTKQFIEDNKEEIDRAKQEVEKLIGDVNRLLTEEQKKELLNITVDYTKEIQKILSANNEEKSIEYEVAKIVRVKDGDTIVAEINGKEETIRLIGIDTPESVGKYKNNPEPYGVEASNFTKSILTPNKTIYLTKDAGDKDKYQRLLRYVWLDKPSVLNIKETMFNAVLVKEGYANTLTIPPNVKYSMVFNLLEKEARELNKGLWSLE
jgi:micrococcal nuclease